MSASTETSASSFVAMRYAVPTRKTAHWRRRAWVGGAVIVGLAGAIGILRPDRWLRGLLSRAPGEAAVHVVTPTTLHITLKEDGELKPVNSVEFKCEVQGERVTIETVVPESTHVKKDDLLVKLVAADMKDRVDLEEMEVRGIATALEEAEQTLEITRSENESKRNKCEIDLEVAELDLQGYLEGDYVKRIKAIEIDIKQNEMDIDQKTDELDKSRPLLEKGFVTKARIRELEDQLEKMQMTLEKNQLELRTLDQYEHQKTLKQKTLAVDQAREELKRELARAASREKQALGKVADQRQALEIRQRRFERSKEQLARCEIHAPCDGVVQYGPAGERRYWSDQRIAAGEQVYAGQTIMTIPDTSQMLVSTRIHEADRHKVREGLTCLVNVPAVPGRTFTGKLSKITKFADSERGWLNPNLKEHAAEIRLDESDPALSPGDTAHIEILIEDVPDVLAVPVQCVFTRGAQHYVFVRKGLSAAPVEVKLGRSTTTMTEITAGVSVGDKVVMSPDEQMLALLPTPAASQPAVPAAEEPPPGPPA